MERRKDNKHRVLKEGEYQRKNQTYEYRWKDGTGASHSVYAKSLDELREKENAVRKDSLDHIRADAKNLTINDLFGMWKKLKRGLKDNTFCNYCYMYTEFVSTGFGERRIQDLKRSDVRNFYNGDSSRQPSTTFIRSSIRCCRWALRTITSAITRQTMPSGS